MKSRNVPYLKSATHALQCRFMRFFVAVGLLFLFKMFLSFLLILVFFGSFCEF